MKKRTFLIGAAAMTGAIIAFRQIFKQENTTDLKSKYNRSLKRIDSEKRVFVGGPYGRVCSKTFRTYHLW